MTLGAFGGSPGAASTFFFFFFCASFELSWGLPPPFSCLSPWPGGGGPVYSGSTAAHFCLPPPLSLPGCEGRRGISTGVAATRCAHRPCPPGHGERPPRGAVPTARRGASDGQWAPRPAQRGNGRCVNWCRAGRQRLKGYADIKGFGEERVEPGPLLGTGKRMDTDGGGHGHNRCAQPREGHCLSPPPPGHAATCTSTLWRVGDAPPSTPPAVADAAASPPPPSPSCPPPLPEMVPGLVPLDVPVRSRDRLAATAALS